MKERVHIIFVIFCLFSLLSCSNFLEGGNFKEQLEADIAYADAAECTLIVSSDASFGNFLSFGEKKCRVGYSIDLQFTLNTNFYGLKNPDTVLEAVSSKNNALSRADCVSFTVTDGNKISGVYKITVKLLKAASDILIRPACYLLSDNVAPSLVSLKIFTTGDKTAPYYHELSPIPYSESDWNEEIFHKNYTSKMYIVVQGYDKDSGLNEIKVSETYIYDLNGNNNPLANIRTVEFHAALDEKGNTIDDGNGNVLYESACDASFTLVTNALIHVEVSLIDYAGNVSEPMSYDVIKNQPLEFGSNSSIKCEKPDTVEKILSLENSLPAFTDFTLQKTPFWSDSLYAPWYVSLAIQNGDTISTVLDSKEFNGSELIDLKSAVNESLSAFKADTSIPTYINLTVVDESGESLELENYIPATPEIVTLSDSSIGFTSSENEYDDFSATYITFYKYKADSDSEFGDFLFASEDVTDTSFLTADGIYEIYDIVYLEGTSPFGRSFSSKLGKPFVYYKGIEKPAVSVPIPNFELSDADSWFLYEENSGIANITVDVDYIENEYKYFLFFDSPEKDYYFAVKSSTVECKVANGYEYKVSIIAKDSSGSTAGQGESQSYSLTCNDNFAPVLRNLDITLYLKNLMHPNSLNFNESLSYYGYDVAEGRNIIEGADNILMAYYFWLPLSSAIPSDDDFIGGKSIKNMGERLSFIYGQIENGFFKLYLQLTDYSFNSVTGSFSYTIPHYVWEISPDLNSDSDSLELSTLAYSENYVNSDFPSDSLGFKVYGTYQYFDTSSSEWVDSGEIVEFSEDNYESTHSFAYTSPGFHGNYVRFLLVYATTSDGTAGGEVTNIVHAMPIYVYPDYEKTFGTDAEIKCDNKAWIKVSNGMQIFCDQPVFVHTMYSNEKISSGTDDESVRKWETYGIETGAVCKDSTFTYTNDNLFTDYNGYYYAIIAHFADGTVLMTEPTD